MTSLTRLGADELRAAVIGFRDVLAAHKEGINRLNVYPVPDGDTGTNMALTLLAVTEELEHCDGELRAVCKAISHGSLMGARGNSGVILSQILRGMSSVIADAGGLDATTAAAALAAASEAAYQAVMRPVEGTILTVVREASEAAVATANGSSDLLAVLEAAKAHGADALRRTPEMLPVLKEAGVVDAGGTGLLLLLDALLHQVDGRPMPEPEEVVSPTLPDVLPGHGEGHGDVSDLRYEVMYFLEAPDEAIPAFKDVWAGMGDSIVVVGGDGIWNCHIHTDDIGGSIEAAIDIGRPTKIRVTDLIEQVEEERWVRDAAESGAIDEVPAHLLNPVKCAVVAVATGDGIRRIFHSLGVQGIVTGGQSMNPSTAELIAAVEKVPADHVVILPNNKNIIPVAEQVDAHTAKTVVVVPTKSITEGFAALLAYDPQAEGQGNCAEMAEAAGNVLAGEVTQAVRDSAWDGGPIATGDWLGVTRDGIKAVEHGLAEAAVALLDALMTDRHEIVTIIEGEGASAGTTRQITEWLGEHRPGAAAEVHHGGQPLYPYLFGIE
ncbi:MAG TPA: DAK2 domain-containing protein [Acidimicrobiales bacterium]|jgi:DAK2 domain fusion protein YloV|nr:DAK2 domain-containing protein [Acidimicrobiales bacterium]